VNKKYLLVIFLIAIIAACKKDGSVGPQGGKDDFAFTLYENHFLDELWKVNPEWAASVGFHKYDSLLFLPNSSYRDKLVNYAKLQLDSLGRFDPKVLSELSKIDYAIMQNQAEAIQWNVQQLRDYEWDPSSYNLIGTFAIILNEHYAPLTKRLESFYQKLEKVPAYYKEAEKQIRNPVVELTDLAIEQHEGGLNIFGKDFADSLKKANVPQEQQKLMVQRASAAAEAVKGYVAFLKALKNDHPHSFRLGKQLYDDKFKYNIQSSINAQQLVNAAEDRKLYLHREMAKISLKLWPKYFDNKALPKDTLEIIAKMIDTLSAKHVGPAGFQSAIEHEIPKLTAFVQSKDLLTLDPTKPLIVRKEPGYMAGVAGAGLTSAGPYDKNGNSYFEVGSLNGWSAERAESYLREYNQYILQILCIHEAIPGHYVQLLYANKAPSLIKSVFGNGAMVEGWAVYSEQMMLDAGFGDNEPEMRLMWYKWHLRSVCNTILDYRVHTGTMSRPDAITFLTHEAFQQKAEAENKWKRVSVTSVQLDSYFAGYKEIMDLREAYKKKMGDKYKLKEFNEKFLSYGSAPVKLIKEAMLGKGL
jgi:uncharacterized protein (DUF885 family)